MGSFAKRALTILGAMLLLAYVGYQVFLAMYTPVKVQTVELYDEYETVDTEGLVVRNETVIPLSKQGFVYYMTENGSRVAKNGCIAELYANQEAAVTQQKINELNAEIATLQSIHDQGQNTRTNLEIITTQMKKMQAQIISCASSSGVAGMDALSAEMLTLMNKQQITIGRVEGFEQQIASLIAQRDALAQGNTAAKDAVHSPTAGYFVNTVDGLENVVDVSTVTSITTDGIRAAMATPPSTDSTGYIGKVVGSYEWYLVCIVPASEMTAVALDGQVRLRLPFVSNDTIPVTLVAHNRDREGNMAVVFCCDYMSAELSDIRLEQVQILVKQHSGLRVPDEAVQFNEAGEAGVFVQEGNMIKFKRIQVKYHSNKEDYSICAVVEEDGYLQVFDDVVMEGKNLYDGKIV